MYDIYNVLNEIISYIEEHILEDIDMKVLSKMAGLSHNTLKSVFNCLCGVSINEYIRLRRLTLSVNDILNGKSITSISYKYLYNSPSSYNRAFKKYEGITPRDLKNNNRELKMFNKIVFKGNIKNYNIDYRIYQNKAFDLYYVSKQVNYNNRSKEITDYWNEVKSNYPEFINNTRYGFLDKRNKKNIIYYCLLENKFKGSKKINVKKRNYFSIKISDYESKNIILNINKAMNEYIKSLNYKLLDEPRIEMYYKDYIEILIPIT